jgi:hypothetical protein
MTFGGHNKPIWALPHKVALGRTTAAMWSLALLSLWLRAAYPPLGAWAPYDDVLFIRMAGQIASGQWLGPYDPLIMAKGVFFPIFLRINKASGLPLKISEHLVYLAAALLASRMLVRLTGRRWLLLPTFAMLAFTPTAWI